MKDRAAVSGDIDRLWPHLAQRMLDEYRLAGFPNVAVARGIFRKAIKAKAGVAYLSDADELLAVMIWQDDPEGTATGFAATDDFFSPAYIRPFYRCLVRFQQQLGNPSLVSHSHSEHPAVAKWFKTLGFELLRENGVHRDFIRHPASTAKV